MTEYQAFQGDVLIESVYEIPKSAKRVTLKKPDMAIIAYGEATGHYHGIHGRGVVHFMADAKGSGALAEQVQYVDIPFGGRLVHEGADGLSTTDHASLPHGDRNLAPGKYRAIRQMEGSWEKEPRLVQD